jgi:hypothetical protein
MPTIALPLQVSYYLTTIFRRPWDPWSSLADATGRISDRQSGGIV